MVISTSNLVGIIDVGVDACGILSKSWISKIRNFNGRSAVRDECASSCQISSKSVKRLQKHDNLTVFKMAAAAILDFQKFKIITVDPLPGANARHLAKFHQTRSNDHRDMAI